MEPFDLLGPLPEPATTTVLEASAGTGKTFTLAGLVARYVAEGVATLDQMLLIPFGRAASQELRERVRADVLERGWNEQKQTFTQHYDTDEVDASLLLIPMVGFLPPDDPRVLGTVDAVERDLMRDGFLLRYRTESGVDGLAGDEHPFLACSWWLVSAYALTGQLDKGHALMQRLCGLLNDVGLVAEEYDVEGDRQASNFPQAFSHLTLIGAAYALRDAEAAAAATPDEGDPA